MKLPPFIELYRALIATPSISATDSALDQSNEALINLLAGWFGDLGFRVEVQPVPHTRNKFNLLASIGQGRGGLMLAGHTDTVPFDDGRWTRDPFTLTEHDNKLYGLGTADMKGFLPLFWMRFATSMPANSASRSIFWRLQMRKPRWLAHAISRRPRIYALTAPSLVNLHLKPVRAHKGHLSEAIRITGQSGHSSDPARGVNAIELMHDSIGHLLTLRNTLKDRYQHDAFNIPYPTMNLGHIHGGDAPNRICACCELHMDIRPLPGMTLNDIDELLNQALAPVSEKWPGRLTIEHLHVPIPGYECPVHAPLIQVIEGLLGERAEVVNYCTEAPFIQEVCPTLVLGPGSIDQAHQPDEFLATSFIQPTRELIGQVVNHFVDK